MSQQSQMAPGVNSQDIEVVYYSGTDTIKTGYALCYDFDNGTDTAADPDRGSVVEKPATRNIQHFAGVVASGYPASGITGPQMIRVIKPNNVVTCAFTDQDTTIGATLLYVQSGSYFLTDAVYTGSTTSVCVGIALQTVTRSSTSGLCQVRLDRHIMGGFGAGSYSSTRQILIPSSGVTSGTTYASATSLRSAQAGGTVIGDYKRLHLTGTDTGTGGANEGSGAYLFRLSFGSTVGAAFPSSALHGNLVFKTGATVGASTMSALSAKVENIDGTPAVLTGTTVVGLDIALQMNEDPGTLAMMQFTAGGSALPGYWFVAFTGDAVAFTTATNSVIDHAIKVRIEGNDYWIGLYDATS